MHIMYNNVNVTFNLISSHSGWETTSIILEDLNKCSNLPQELVNCESREDIHLPAPGLSRGYSGNCASL